MPHSSYKRSSPAQQLQFQRPLRACYACDDTGVIVNGDALVNEYLPDYDRLADGRRLQGSDLELICHCAAAFPLYEGEKTARSGFREPSGAIRRVDGRHAVGAEIPRAVTMALHERRRRAWSETEALMNEVRQARAGGQSDARPWFLAELRAVMQLAGDAESRIPAAAGSGALQSIGGCLAEVIGSSAGLRAAADAATAPETVVIQTDTD